MYRFVYESISYPSASTTSTGFGQSSTFSSGTGAQYVWKSGAGVGSKIFLVLCVTKKCYQKPQFSYVGPRKALA